MSSRKAEVLEAKVSTRPSLLAEWVCFMQVTHLPTGIQALNQESRDQNHNKKIAIDIVKQKLFKIEHDKYYEELGNKRRLQMGSTDRSDKIRTYNFPQDRITDHRMGLTKFGILDFMSGGDLMNEFVEEFRNLEYEAKIKELLEEDTKASTK